MKPPTRFYRDPEFQRWLAIQTPWKELVYRIALKDKVRDAVTASDWTRRIYRLQGRLVRDADDVSRLLVDISRAKSEFAKVVDAEEKSSRPSLR
jgi:hypothetical protein